MSVTSFLSFLVLRFFPGKKNLRSIPQEKQRKMIPGGQKPLLYFDLKDTPGIVLKICHFITLLNAPCKKLKKYVYGSYSHFLDFVEVMSVRLAGHLSIFRSDHQSVGCVYRQKHLWFWCHYRTTKRHEFQFWVKFLNVFSHLYKRVCLFVLRSVRLSVHPSVHRSVTHELNFQEMGWIGTK